MRAKPALETVPSLRLLILQAQPDLFCKSRSAPHSNLLDKIRKDTFSLMVSEQVPTSITGTDSILKDYFKSKTDHLEISIVLKSKIITHTALLQ